MYMQKTAKVLSLALLCSSFAYAGYGSLFRIMEEMDRHMEHIRQEMHAIFSTVTNESYKNSQQIHPITVTEQEDVVIVTTHVKSGVDTFDAKTKGSHRLVISIPQDHRKITISTKGRMINVESNTHVQEEHIHDETEDRDNKYHFSSFGSSSMARSLQYPVDITKASIEFEQGKLTITIPKIKPEEKKIEVKVKAPEPKKEDASKEVK